jgi:uncharacterized membrane protein YtjA (UPF0391 family)
MQSAKRKYYSTKEVNMLGWAIFFLIVAVIAGLLGFGGIAGAATSIAQVLAVIFLILFIGSLIFGRTRV